MVPKRLTAIRIDEELLDAMTGVWERDGILVPEQVRRAVRMWLESKGVKLKKVERKGSASRRASS